MNKENREQQMMADADKYADDVCDESCTGAQVAETINDFCAGWRAADNSRWIPVEKELPKEGQVVVIHTKGGSVSTACYTDGSFDITELLEAINVTHWMPLPQPPQGKEE